jgi:hypothetical protein
MSSNQISANAVVGRRDGPVGANCRLTKIAGGSARVVFRKPSHTMRFSPYAGEDPRDAQAPSHSSSLDRRGRPETLRTAIAMAFFWPTGTTSRRGDVGVEEVSLQHGILLSQDRDDHGWILRPLLLWIVAAKAASSPRR